MKDEVEPIIVKSRMFKTLRRKALEMAPLRRKVALAFDVFEYDEVTWNVPYPPDTEAPKYVLMFDVKFLFYNMHQFLGNVTYFKNTNKQAVANTIKAFIDDLFQMHFEVIISLSSGKEEVIRLLQALPVMKTIDGTIEYTVGKVAKIVHIFDPTWLFMEVCNQFKKFDIKYVDEKGIQIASFMHTRCINIDTTSNDMITSYEKLFSEDVARNLEQELQNRNCFKASVGTPGFLNFIRQLRESFKSDFLQPTEQNPDTRSRIRKNIWRDSNASLETMNFIRFPEENFSWMVKPEGEGSVKINGHREVEDIIDKFSSIEDNSTNMTENIQTLSEIVQKCLVYKLVQDEKKSRTNIESKEIDTNGNKNQKLCPRNENFVENYFNQQERWRTALTKKPCPDKNRKLYTEENQIFPPLDDNNNRYSPAEIQELPLEERVSSKNAKIILEENTNEAINMEIKKLARSVSDKLTSMDSFLTDEEEDNMTNKSRKILKPQSSFKRIKDGGGITTDFEEKRENPFKIETLPSNASHSLNCNNEEYFTVNQNHQKSVNENDINNSNVTKEIKTTFDTNSKKCESNTKFTQPDLESYEFLVKFTPKLELNHSKKYDVSIKILDSPKSFELESKSPQNEISKERITHTLENDQNKAWQQTVEERNHELNKILKKLSDDSNSNVQTCLLGDHLTNSFRSVIQQSNVQNTTKSKEKEIPNISNLISQTNNDDVQNTNSVMITINENVQKSSGGFEYLEFNATESTPLEIKKEQNKCTNAQKEKSETVSQKGDSEAILKISSRECNAINSEIMIDDESRKEKNGCENNATNIESRTILNSAQNEELALQKDITVPKLLNDIQQRKPRRRKKKQPKKYETDEINSKIETNKINVSEFTQSKKIDQNKPLISNEKTDRPQTILESEIEDETGKQMVNIECTKEAAKSDVEEEVWYQQAKHEVTKVEVDISTQKMDFEGEKSANMNDENNELLRTRSMDLVLMEHQYSKTSSSSQENSDLQKVKSIRNNNILKRPISLQNMKNVVNIFQKKAENSPEELEKFESFKTIMDVLHQKSTRNDEIFDFESQKHSNQDIKIGISETLDGNVLDMKMREAINSSEDNINESYGEQISKLNESEIDRRFKGCQEYLELGETLEPKNTTTKNFNPINYSDGQNDHQVKVELQRSKKNVPKQTINNFRAKCEKEPQKEHNLLKSDISENAKNIDVFVFETSKGKIPEIYGIKNGKRVDINIIPKDCHHVSIYRSSKGSVLDVFSSWFLPMSEILALNSNGVYILYTNEDQSEDKYIKLGEFYKSKHKLEENGVGSKHSNFAPVDSSIEDEMTTLTILFDPTRFIEIGKQLKFIIAENNEKRIVKEEQCDDGLHPSTSKNKYKKKAKNKYHSKSKSKKNKKNYSKFKINDETLMQESIKRDHMEVKKEYMRVLEDEVNCDNVKVIFDHLQQEDSQCHRIVNAFPISSNSQKNISQEEAASINEKIIEEGMANLQIVDDYVTTKDFVGHSFNSSLQIDAVNTEDVFVYPNYVTENEKMEFEPIAMKNEDILKMDANSSADEAIGTTSVTVNQVLDEIKAPPATEKTSDDGAIPNINEVRSYVMNMQRLNISNPELGKPTLTPRSDNLIGVPLVQCQTDKNITKSKKKRMKRKNNKKKAQIDDSNCSTLINKIEEIPKTNMVDANSENNNITDPNNKSSKTMDIQEKKNDMCDEFEINISQLKLIGFEDNDTATIIEADRLLKAYNAQNPLDTNSDSKETINHLNRDCLKSHHKNCDNLKHSYCVNSFKVKTRNTFNQPLRFRNLTNSKDDTVESEDTTVDSIVSPSKLRMNSKCRPGNQFANSTSLIDKDSEIESELTIHQKPSITHTENQEKELFSSRHSLCKQPKNLTETNFSNEICSEVANVTTIKKSPLLPLPSKFINSEENDIVPPSSKQPLRKDSDRITKEESGTRSISLKQLQEGKDNSLSLRIETSNQENVSPFRNLENKENTISLLHNPLEENVQMNNLMKKDSPTLSPFTKSEMSSVSNESRKKRKKQKKVNCIPPMSSSTVQEELLNELKLKNRNDISPPLKETSISDLNSSDLIIKPEKFDHLSRTTVKDYISDSLLLSTMEKHENLKKNCDNIHPQNIEQLRNELSQTEINTSSNPVMKTLVKRRKKGAKKSKSKSSDLSNDNVKITTSSNENINKKLYAIDEKVDISTYQEIIESVPKETSTNLSTSSLDPDIIVSSKTNSDLQSLGKRRKKNVKTTCANSWEVESVDPNIIKMWDQKIVSPTMHFSSAEETIDNEMSLMNASSLTNGLEEGKTKRSPPSQESKLLPVNIGRSPTILSFPQNQRMSKYMKVGTKYIEVTENEETEATDVEKAPRKLDKRNFIHTPISCKETTHKENLTSNLSLKTKVIKSTNLVDKAIHIETPAKEHSSIDLDNQDESVCLYEQTGFSKKKTRRSKKNKKHATKSLDETSYQRIAATEDSQTLKEEEIIDSTSNQVCEANTVVTEQTPSNYEEIIASPRIDGVMCENPETDIFEERTSSVVSAEITPHLPLPNKRRKKIKFRPLYLDEIEDIATSQNQTRKNEVRGIEEKNDTSFPRKIDIHKKSIKIKQLDGADDDDDNEFKSVKCKTGNKKTKRKKKTQQREATTVTDSKSIEVVSASILYEDEDYQRATTSTSSFGFASTSTETLSASILHEDREVDSKEILIKSIGTNCMKKDSEHDAIENTEIFRKKSTETSDSDAVPFVSCKRGRRKPRSKNTNDIMEDPVIVSASILYKDIETEFTSQHISTKKRIEQSSFESKTRKDLIKNSDGCKEGIMNAHIKKKNCTDVGIQTGEIVEKQQVEVGVQTCDDFKEEKITNATETSELGIYDRSIFPDLNMTNERRKMRDSNRTSRCASSALRLEEENGTSMDMKMRTADVCLKEKITVTHVESSKFSLHVAPSEDKLKKATNNDRKSSIRQKGDNAINGKGKEIQKSIDNNHSSENDKQGTMKCIGNDFRTASTRKNGEKNTRKVFNNDATSERETTEDVLKQGKEGTSLGRKLDDEDMMKKGTGNSKISLCEENENKVTDFAEVSRSFEVKNDEDILKEYVSKKNEIENDTTEAICIDLTVQSDEKMKNLTDDDVTEHEKEKQKKRDVENVANINTSLPTATSTNIGSTFSSNAKKMQKNSELNRSPTRETINIVPTKLDNDMMKINTISSSEEKIITNSQCLLATNIINTIGGREKLIKTHNEIFNSTKSDNLKEQKSPDIDISKTNKDDEQLFGEGLSSYIKSICDKEESPSGTNSVQAEISNSKTPVLSSFQKKGKSKSKKNVKSGRHSEEKNKNEIKCIAQSEQEVLAFASSFVGTQIMMDVMKSVNYSESSQRKTTEYMMKSNFKVGRNENLVEKRHDSNIVEKIITKDEEVLKEYSEKVSKKYKEDVIKKFDEALSSILRRELNFNEDKSITRDVDFKCEGEATDTKVSNTDENIKKPVEGKTSGRIEILSQIEDSETKKSENISKNNESNETIHCLTNTKKISTTTKLEEDIIKKTGMDISSQPAKVEIEEIANLYISNTRDMLIDPSVTQIKDNHIEKKYVGQSTETYIEEIPKIGSTVTEVREPNSVMEDIPVIKTTTTIEASEICEASLSSVTKGEKIYDQTIDKKGRGKKRRKKRFHSKNVSEDVKANELQSQDEFKTFVETTLEESEETASGDIMEASLCEPSDVISNNKEVIKIESAELDRNQRDINTLQIQETKNVFASNETFEDTRKAHMNNVLEPTNEIDVDATEIKAVETINSNKRKTELTADEKLLLNSNLSLRPREHEKNNYESVFCHKRIVNSTSKLDESKIHLKSLKEGKGVNQKSRRNLQTGKIEQKPLIDRKLEQIFTYIYSEELHSRHQFEKFQSLLFLFTEIIRLLSMKFNFPHSIMLLQRLSTIKSEAKKWNRVSYFKHTVIKISSQDELNMIIYDVFLPLVEKLRECYFEEFIDASTVQDLIFSISGLIREEGIPFKSDNIFEMWAFNLNGLTNVMEKHDVPTDQLLIGNLTCDTISDGIFRSQVMNGKVATKIVCAPETDSLDSELNFFALTEDGNYTVRVFDDDDEQGK